MSDGNTVPLEVLIQIRDELAGLNRTRAGLADTKKEAEGLGTALRQGLGIGSGIALATAGIGLLTSTLKASVGEAFRLAEETRNVARANDMTAESYQVLKDLIEDTGGNVGSLTMGLKEMREALAGAGQSSGAAEAFRELGINVDSFAKLPVEQKLETIARATFSAENRTQALSQASQILGSRNVPQLTNALRTLAEEGYAKVAKEAKEAGQVMSNDTIERLAKARVDWKNFRDSVTTGTGGGIAWLQSAMENVGASAANFVNAWQGIPMSALPGPPAERSPRRDETIYASQEDILRAQLGMLDQNASRIGTFTSSDTEKRKMLAGIYGDQAALLDKLGATQFGGNWRERMGVFQGKSRQGSITEAELTELQKIYDLEQQITQKKQERLEQVDTPLLAMLRQMSDTTALIQTSLAQGIGQAIGQLGNDIWEASKGTQSWSQAWRNMGDIAGRTLTNIVTQMLVIQALNGVLGLFGIKIDGAGPTLGKIGKIETSGIPTLPGGASTSRAGGGTFFTSGRTNLTVGDNPGGIELVSVIPISGIGQTLVNGQRAAMGGGGTLLAAGRGMGGVPIVVNQHLHVSTGVAGTVRAEIMGMLPLLRELAVDSTREALARGDL